MHKIRWQLVPVGLAAIGIVAVWACAFAARDALGGWQYGIYAAGLLALIGAVWRPRRASSAETELELLRAEIAAEQIKIDQERRGLLAARKAAAKQLDRYVARLDKREQALAGKLIAYYEWMDFPQPIDLASDPAADVQLSELAEKDRQVMELLDAESKRLYENIRTNKYAKEGRFQAALLRDDVYQLIGQVARIYYPQAENPLFETSVAQILRAASRACLHFLVVLEQLPLNVKEYNVNSMYGYVRQAVKAYGVFKSAEPYFPYVNSVYLLSRYAMGANPVSLGAWWVLSQLSKKGAKALTARIVNRQALALLYDVVRVIGYEVAGIYGGDFRHRDANWIYAAELTDLVSRFPLSRDSLAQALKEVGAVQFRNEYDRIFLFRCLAAHASAQPERFRAADCLSVQERQAIAVRLEKFLEAFVHGKSADRVERWKSAVEKRLHVKLAIAAQHGGQPEWVQVEDAIRSLASFLLAIKQREIEELPELLPLASLFSDLSEDDRRRLLTALQENPPFFFEQPDIDLAGKLAARYLRDVALLAVRTYPYDARMDESLVDAAGYLRQDAKAIRESLDREYVAYVAELLSPAAPLRRLPPDVCRAALYLLGPNEQPRFVYGGLSWEGPEDLPGAEVVKKPMWLLGVGERLILFTVNGQVRLLWRGDANVKAERAPGYFVDDCRLTGGVWLADPESPAPPLRVRGSLMSRYAAYFQPLLAFCSPRPASEEKVDAPAQHPAAS